MKKAPTRCPQCGANHSEELRALEAEERRLRGPDFARLDARASEGMRDLVELFEKTSTQEDAA